MFTSGSSSQVADRLTRLVEPYAEINAERDTWMPRGFLEPKESTLDKRDKLLASDHCQDLIDWWLARPRGATKPTWDIASTAMIGGQKGIILIEAKAHHVELSDAGKSPGGNSENSDTIQAAIRQANTGLGGAQAGWNLTTDSHYQLCNRFVWSWKIASLGVPVILVYLGFLNAEEMSDIGQPFRSVNEWSDLINSHSVGIVPNSAWEYPIDVNGTPMRAVIRAVGLNWSVESLL
jgi:hypothetical protein